MTSFLLSIPLIALWVLLFLGRDKLGLKGIAIAITAWAVIWIGCSATGLAPSLYNSAVALLDVVLVLVVYRGDVRIR
jgi:hypothetical protein